MPNEECSVNVSPRKIATQEIPSSTKQLISFHLGRSEILCCCFTVGGQPHAFSGTNLFIFFITHQFLRTKKERNLALSVAHQVSIFK